MKAFCNRSARGADRSRHAQGYDDDVKQMGEEKEVHARHILSAAPPATTRPQEAEGQGQGRVSRASRRARTSPRSRATHRGSLRQANGGALAFLPRSQMCRNSRRRSPCPRQRSPAGEEPVRLARHQGRRIARKPAQPNRGRQAADRAYVVRKAQAELVTSLRRQRQVSNGWTSRRHLLNGQAR